MAVRFSLRRRQRSTPQKQLRSCGNEDLLEAPHPLRSVSHQRKVQKAWRSHKPTFILSKSRKQAKMGWIWRRQRTRVYAHTERKLRRRYSRAASQCHGKFSGNNFLLKRNGRLRTFLQRIRRVGSSIVIATFCSWVARSRLNLLSYFYFVYLPSSRVVPSQMNRPIPRLQRSRFLPNPFKFITRKSKYYLLV
jgi:hypothetical protein